MEIIREILPFLVSIVTLAAGWFGGRHKSAAEVEAVKVDNTKQLLETNEEFIVKPIKMEINALRKEIRKLRGAIARVGDCPHADGCPVINELQKQPDSNGQSN